MVILERFVIFVDSLYRCFGVYCRLAEVYLAYTTCNELDVLLSLGDSHYAVLLSFYYTS